MSMLPLLSYFNSKEVTFARAFVYSFFTYCEERGWWLLPLGKLFGKGFWNCARSGIYQSMPYVLAAGSPNPQ